jgi:hypothetical protein
MIPRKIITTKFLNSISTFIRQPKLTVTNIRCTQRIRYIIEEMDKKNKQMIICYTDNGKKLQPLK